MAYSLRLSDALDREARARCERLGISLNGLISVALDAYLRGPESLPKAESVAPAPQPEQPSARAEPANPRKAKYPSPSLRAAGESSFAASEPKPVLGPKPSKADRSRLADWYRAHPKP